MSTPVLMPKLGESVVEGTVARWLKSVGDAITKLEPLLEISTDKIDTEIPAPASGILLEILVPEGKTVKAGSIMATIGAAGEAGPVLAAPEAVDALAAADRQASVRPSGRSFVSPVVARMVSEHGVNLGEVAGTGLGGRVTKKDVLEFVARRQAATESAPAAGSPSAMPQVDAAPAPRPAEFDGAGDEVLQPLTSMRRAIAQHMVQSKQTSPHVTTIFEVDMTAVVQHREQMRAAFTSKGVRLTFTPYFVAAVATALRATPLANSRYSADGIILSRRIHIGVAVALESNGLVVPVIRDADEKNLLGLARSVEELSVWARAGKLTPDLLQGGTFTVTNHGVSGSLIGTPIINQPQSGILGVGAIVKRPVVRSSGASLLPSADDAIVIRPMCYLSYSFDHRLLDGASADRFLMVVKNTLEHWQLNS